jgi:hypothetical protein
LKSFSFLFPKFISYNNNIIMDVGELLNFKPATAPKRPAPTQDPEDDVEDEDDPSEKPFFKICIVDWT